MALIVVMERTLHRANEAFDAQLRQKNSDWGVRDLESLEKLGQSVGLSLDGGCGDASK